MQAIVGGLTRIRRCKWREGIALKKEQPGMRRVWIIFGLSSRGDRQQQYLCGAGVRLHAHGVSEPSDPDGSAGDFHDAEDQNDKNH